MEATRNVRTQRERIPGRAGPRVGRIAAWAVATPLLAGLLVLPGCSEGTTSPGGQVFFECASGMAVSPAEAQMEVEGTFQFSAACGPDLENDVTGEASWTTSDPEIATVDDNGLATGVAEGEAIITAIEEGQEDSATLRVTAFDLSVAPTGDTISEGQTLQMTATRVASDQSEDVTELAEWRSTDESVATVSNLIPGSKGLVAGVQFGEANIIAEFEGVADTAFVLVAPDVTGSGPNLFTLEETSENVLWGNWYTVDPAGGELSFVASRDMSGDGERAPGQPEHAVGVPGGAAVTFAGSQESIFFKLNDETGGIERVGSVEIGESPSGGDFENGLYYQSGRPQTATELTSADVFDPASWLVPEDQGLIGAVGLYEGHAYAQTASAGRLFVNERADGRLDFVESLDTDHTGGDLEIAFQGGYMASTGIDPASSDFKSVVLILHIAEDGIPTEMQVLEFVEASIQGTAFGGDPSWSSVCLVVPVRPTVDAADGVVRSFRIDRETGDVEEAPGSPVSAPMVWDLAADEEEGRLVVVITDVATLSMELANPDCELTVRDQVETGSGRFNLDVTFVPGN